MMYPNLENRIPKKSQENYSSSFRFSLTNHYPSSSNKSVNSSSESIIYRSKSTRKQTLYSSIDKGYFTCISKKVSSFKNSKHNLSKVSLSYSFTPRENYWYLDRINELRKIENSFNWNRDFERPNATSIYWSKVALEYLRVIDFSCDRIIPSVEEGIAICFVRDTLYADLEFFNEGDIFGVTTVREESQPTVFEVPPDRESIKDAIDQIKDFLDRQN